MINSITNVLSLLQRNGWTIVFCVLLGYLFQTKVIHPKMESYYREKSYLEATNPERVGVLGQDMERIRERQQEEHERKVAEAKEAAGRKRVEEMRRKRIEDPNNKKGGRKLGGGTDGNATKDATKSAVNPTGRGSYNALNPSSGNASGYRPARRNPNNRS